MRGFIREIYIVLAVIVGSILSRGLSSGRIFAQNRKSCSILGLLRDLCWNACLGAVITWLVTRFMKFAKLQWADRLLGGAFGFIRGWMIGAVILLVLTAFDVQTERVRNSLLAPYFLPGSRALAVMTPYELKAKFLVGYRALERWWQQQ
jgi:membrane protein required for colicin V production